MDNGKNTNPAAEDITPANGENPSVPPEGTPEDANIQSGDGIIPDGGSTPEGGAPEGTPGSNPEAGTEGEDPNPTAGADGEDSLTEGDEYSGAPIEGEEVTDKEKEEYANLKDKRKNQPISGQEVLRYDALKKKIEGEGADA